MQVHRNIAKEELCKESFCYPALIGVFRMQIEKTGKELLTTC